jgi:hypothetical protein
MKPWNKVSNILTNLSRDPLEKNVIPIDDSNQNTLALLTTLFKLTEPHQYPIYLLVEEIPKLWMVFLACVSINDNTRYLMQCLFPTKSPFGIDGDT